MKRSVTLFFLACGLANVSAQTAMTVTASPSVLTFSYQLGTATLPASQSVSLKTTTTSVTAALAVTGDNGGDWITTSLRPGTSFKLPASFSVTVTPTGLSAGNYSAVITVTAAASGGSQTATVPISVTLTVLPPPSTLRVAPDKLTTFTYTTGGKVPDPQTFLLYSDGSPMSVTLAVSSAPWLKLNPTGTVQVIGITKGVQVSIDSLELAKLAPKTYTAAIAITAPTATNKSISYPVTLTVNAAAPTVTGTWPAGVVMNAAGSGTTTIVVNGANFFSTSTVAVSGFTPSAVVKVNDAGAPTLIGAETLSVPVYSSSATGLRTTFASPLPTAFGTQAYTCDLSTRYAGTASSVVWSIDGAPDTLAIAPNGVITWASPVPGNYSFSVSVSTADGSATAYMPVSLTVYASAASSPGTVRLIVPAVLPAAVAGSAYNAVLSADGGSGSYGWQVDPTTAFAGGLSLSATSGSSIAVTGTPVASSLAGSLTAKLLSDGAMQVTVPNTYISKLGILRVNVSTPVPGGGISNEAQLSVYGPEPRILSIGNAASYVGGSIAPGELVTIFGTGLGPAVMSVYDPNAASLPLVLPPGSPATGTTTVSFVAGSNTYKAALLYVSSNQIGAMVPFEIAGAATTQLIVDFNGLASKAFPLNVAAVVPGIFTLDGSGKGQGAILNYIDATKDYVVNSGSNTAVKGSTVVMYLTGFGITNPCCFSAAWAPLNLNTATPVSVTIDGKAASVSTAVPPGSFPGVLQVNAVVPSDTTSGKAVPIVVSIAGINAQSGVTMGVK